MVTREEAVGRFNDAADNDTFRSGGSILQHATCFAEEVGELGQAISDYLDDQSDANRAQLAKEWADVQVTLSNLAWFFDLDGDQAFWRVHENNMTKLHPTSGNPEGRIVRREDGKILKPEGYQKPDMGGL